MCASALHAGTPGPTEWDDWRAYRHQVEHPAAAIRSGDLDRARGNLERHGWAKRYLARLRADADNAAARMTPDYLEQMIEHTTPGCTGPCPACRDKGLPWHPNGHWEWSPDEPEQLRCRACGTVYPHDAYPESVVVQSTWDPRQEFRFIGGDTFKCFGYTRARPSLSGIIRARKLGYVTRQIHTLARAYALTGEASYAHATRRGLLRLAEAFPRYLVRAGYGYGEYADCDPHVAAERIADLPNDELVYPPNTPDRKLFAGYWAASRIGSSGMDGRWVSNVAEAYDLACTAHDDDDGPVFSEEERVRIERDVLLESTYLAACDPAINNKSVGNRAGCAMVGMVVGHPDLVRFGLEGFRRTVDEWFLPDGGSSESPAYAMMTMNGVRDFALMFRDVSDPLGYLAPDGTRMDDFNACRDTRYGDCWQGLIWTLQGDLRHPPSADSYRTTSIGPQHAELVAAVLPSGRHRSLLREYAPAGPSGGAAAAAVLYREPGFDAGSVASPLSLPDVVFPFLAQGYLRTGGEGRDGLVLLNASNWGSHHHRDSLDLYYWKDGRELLSDLGYLWDHPDKPKTSRTFAHNTVMVDGAEQVTSGRGGSFHLFALTPRVKAMEASSRAYYPSADVYRRLCVQVDHGKAGSYVLDVFLVRGGTSRQYVFHGPGNSCTIDGLDLRPMARADAGPSPAAHTQPLPLQNIRQARGGEPWQILWRFEDGYTFTAWSPGAAGETVIVGDGWGQRDHRNTDRGATLPYVVRETRGEDLDAFVSVFCGLPKGRELVKRIRHVPLPRDAPADAVCVEVATTDGTDIILASPTPQLLTVPTSLGTVASDGRLAVALSANGTVDTTVLVGGTHLSVGNDASATTPCPSFQGDVVSCGSADGNSWYVVDVRLPADAVGQTFFVHDNGIRRAYPIRALQPTEAGAVKVLTKRNHVGFEARPATTWQYLPTVRGQALIND